MAKEITIVSTEEIQALTIPARALDAYKFAYEATLKGFVDEEDGSSHCQCFQEFGRCYRLPG